MKVLLLSAVLGLLYAGHGEAQLLLKPVPGVVHPGIGSFFLFPQINGVSCFCLPAYPPKLWSVPTMTHSPPLHLFLEKAYVTCNDLG